MMDEGMLSQDEIDAILKIGDSEDADQSLENDEQYLSTIEKDTLGEIGNISFGSSATTLSTLLNQKVDITTPTVEIINQSEVGEEFSFPHVRIQVNYVEGFSGKNLFIIRSSDAAIISDIMLGGNGQNPDPELNEIHLSAVQEAMNQMMGAAATSMSTIFEKKVDISPPSIELCKEEETHHTSKIIESDPLVKVSFQLKVGDLIDSSIMQVMPLPFAQQLAAQLLNGQSAEAGATLEELDHSIEATHKQAGFQHEQSEMVEPHHGTQYIGTLVDKQNANVQQAAFADFQPVELNRGEQRNLDMLLDIPLKVTVELGRTKQTIKEILELSAGSIIELDKLAGEPVDILVNEKLIAKGEVVVIDENFGVRVTDIISQSDRLNKLK